MDKSILVVDDEPQILSSLRRALRNQSYSVLFAKDGHEALEILKQHEVALILSDYMMPGLSGTELLTEAERLQPNTIRIILSGHSDFQTVLQSIKEGIVHKFLAKPWTNDVLIEQINKALESGHYPPKSNSEAKVSSTPQSQTQAHKKSYEMRLSLDNKITSIASELADLFEYNELDLCGEDLSVLFSEQSYQQHLDCINEHRQTSVNWHLPVKQRIAQTQSNSFLSVELSMAFQQDCIICSISPIQAPSPKGKGLDAILESIQGPYLLIDKLGKIRKFNQKCVDLYAEFSPLNKGESLNDFISQCCKKGAFPEAKEHQTQWLESFSLFDENTNEHIFKDDTWIKIKATRAPEGAKILLHFDITQKKQMQLSLRKALIEAEQAKQEKAEVIESLHKNLVLPMKDQVLEPLEQLKGTDLNDTQKDYLENAMESGSQILSNMNSITRSKNEND